MRKHSVANGLRDELLLQDLRRTSEERVADALALGARDVAAYASANGVSRRKATEVFHAMRAMGRKPSGCAGPPLVTASALSIAVSTARAASVDIIVIGAAAMAVGGIVRSTTDLDLLAMEERLLWPKTWDAARRLHVGIDVRCGDEMDPLRGVVRIGPHARLPVDVVVGRGQWMRDIIARTIAPDGLRGVFSGIELPVAKLSDIILRATAASAGLESDRAGPHGQQTVAGPDRRVGNWSESVSATVSARCPVGLPVRYAPFAPPYPRGSSRSRSQSPVRLKPSTVSVMATPAVTASRGAWSR